MRTVTTSTLAAIWLLGCGASMSAPKQHMADAQSAHQSATELGAANLPQAQLYLKLAQDEITQGNAAIANGDNQAADALFVRSKADSELALALVREQNAKGEANRATDQSNAQRTTNATQGAQ